MVKDSNAPITCGRDGSSMLVLLMGILSFALFFASDYNDLRLRHRGLVFLFPAGAVLLTAAAALGCLHGTSPLPGLLWRIISGAAGLAFLLLMLHALFLQYLPGPPTGAPEGGGPPLPPAYTDFAGIRGCCFLYL